MNRSKNPTSNLVIVVEDDEAIRVAAALLLEDAGFEVETFDNVEDAASFLRNNPKGIRGIFFDVHLRGELDGFGLSEIAQRVTPDVLLIATSGRIPDAVERLPVKVVFLPKPWRSEDVVALLRRPSGGSHG